ncbi:hypothetical protein [Nonomuraea rubra]|uniref:Uncharacterized protein n=1 Tax=Nonomuraea rubra TaxID=46180 RepID=A0A7X0NPR3_9ACTN|nr:hypothetical protein [Nonomuraea rubra]MBB6547264.1 hypothetical protein [Nonomuraea rubra]
MAKAEMMGDVLDLSVDLEVFSTPNGGEQGVLTSVQEPVAGGWTTSTTCWTCPWTCDYCNTSECTC